MLSPRSASHITALACTLSLGSCSLSQSRPSAPRTDEELISIIEPDSGASPGVRCGALNDLACALARRGIDLDRADRYFREADTIAKGFGASAEVARASISLNHLHLFLTREDLPGLERRALDAYNEPSPHSLLRLVALAGLGRGLQMQGARPAGALLTRLAYVGVHEQGQASHRQLLSMISLDVDAVNRVITRRDELSSDGWPKLRAFALKLDAQTRGSLGRDVLTRVIQDFVKRPGNGDVKAVIELELTELQSATEHRAEHYLRLSRAIASAYPKNLPTDATEMRQIVERTRALGQESIAVAKFPGDRRQLYVGLATLSHLLGDTRETRDALQKARALDLDEGYPVELLDRWLEALNAIDAQRVGEAEGRK